MTDLEKKALGEIARKIQEAMTDVGNNGRADDPVRQNILNTLTEAKLWTIALQENGEE